MSDEDLFAPIEKAAERPAPAQPLHRRYRMERDTITTSTVGGCDYCECDRCIDTGGAEEEVEVIRGWSIFEVARGHREPIAFVYQVKDAERILEALNSNGK